MSARHRREEDEGATNAGRRSAASDGSGKGGKGEGDSKKKSSILSRFVRVILAQGPC